jgi:hypothetical protein
MFQEQLYSRPATPLAVHMSFVCAGTIAVKLNAINTDEVERAGRTLMAKKAGASAGSSIGSEDSSSGFPSMVRLLEQQNLTHFFIFPPTTVPKNHFHAHVLYGE